MTEPMNVVKYGYALAVSNQLLDGSAEAVRAMQRWMNASPEEHRRWVAEARQARAEQRAAVAPVPLTMQALTDRMGWSREYAEHLVQPYCECGDDIDGWSYCRHAQDLGLAP